jgi:hypothetical protein
MSVHAYPTAALAGDYARAALGFALVTMPLVVVPLGLTIAGLLGAASVLFAAFGARTALRQLRRLELTDEGIAFAGMLPGGVGWDELRDVRLAYYSTHRDGRDGWMQLALRGERRTLRVDSRIAGFDAIAAKVAEVAERRRLPLTASTSANFAALGIRLDREQP